MEGRTFNQLFVQRLESNEGREKLAQFGGNYIRDHLREESYAAQVIPPEPVQPSECDRSETHDTLVKMVELEPKSRAMAVTFRGSPSANFVRTRRVVLPFFTISSEKNEKYEEELLAYEMPVTKIIEDNNIKDLQEVQDREFTIHVEAAVQALQAEANGVSTAPSLSASTLQGASPPVEFSVVKGELARNATANSSVSWPMQSTDLVSLFKLLDNNRHRTELVLIPEGNYDDVLTWTVEDLGDRVKSETAVDGYKYNTLMGRKFIRTIKTDILRPGNIYAFTKAEFLGRFYTLTDVKFYIDKIANLITWQSWKTIAMGIVNISSCRKLELYSGDATINNADGIIANVSPVEEESLGAMNNKVEQGLYYPQVDRF